jgi:hypothetical protein
MRVMEWARKRARKSVLLQYWLRTRNTHVARDVFDVRAKRMGYVGAGWGVAVEMADRCERAEAAFKDLSMVVEMEDVAQAMPFLRPAQVERLVMLIERCGEVSVMAGKVLRYGYNGTSPRTGLPNRVVLERKVGGLLAMIDLMARTGDARLCEVRTSRDWASKHLADWAIHQASDDEVA